MLHVTFLRQNKQAKRKTAYGVTTSVLCYRKDFYLFLQLYTDVADKENPGDGADNSRQPIHKKRSTALAVFLTD